LKCDGLSVVGWRINNADEPRSACTEAKAEKTEHQVATDAAAAASAPVDVIADSDVVAIFSPTNIETLADNKRPQDIYIHFAIIVALNSQRGFDCDSRL